MGKVCEISKPSSFKEEQISDIWSSQCVFLAQGMEIFKNHYNNKFSLSMWALLPFKG